MTTTSWFVIFVVDVGGIEPPTPGLSDRYTNQLCYTSVSAHNDRFFVRSEFSFGFG